jgi:hypothetical protein
MAASPDWKVYDAQGVYQAACKEVEAAAAMMGFYGDGATIRWGHRIVVWTEGAEEQPAGESYDEVAALAEQRINQHRRRADALATELEIRDAGLA